ncbi:hypothetical protein [Endozoicomonas arenosclerae]|uniref:hypothetical protein n=1 Tax=Endozoicomonas arenosclerae TaxID=1633495 RepID=UPI000A501BCB|nr:hypothetical protein [Endozoicomonas arenosclerae]
MKRITLVLASLCVLLISPLTQARAQEAALNFYFQKNPDSKGYAVTLPVTLGNPASRGRPMELNEFPAFKVAIQQGMQGLDILFFDKLSGKLLTKMRYPMVNRLQNTFQTQGFTGLQYIHHPNGSVLQFIGMVR